MNPAVSVVIPARNAAATLGAQLEALLVQEYEGKLEIVVVDNGSTDGTREVAGQFEGGRWPVRVVHEPVPGLNRARNAGVASATGEFVLLCDADDVVERNWVREMARVLGDADLVGGAVETSSMNSPAVRELWNALPIIRPRGHYAGFESPWGCNCGFRRTAWEAVQGFDPELSYVIDEIEFFVRAQLAGFRLRFADDAIVHYRLRDNPQSVMKRRYQNGIASALLAKRFGPRQPGMVVVKSALADWFWIVTRAIPALFISERRWAWRLRFARRRGRLVGSIKYRVLQG